jgi:hypothetical protein
MRIHANPDPNTDCNARISHQTQYDWYKSMARKNFITAGKKDVKGTVAPD